MKTAIIALVCAVVLSEEWRNDGCVPVQEKVEQTSGTAIRGAQVGRNHVNALNV